MSRPSSPSQPSPPSPPDPEEFFPLLSARIDDPYPLYRRYREAGGLHRVLRPGTGREPEWLVLGYDAAATVLAGRGYGRRAGTAGVGPEEKVSIVPARFPALRALVDNWLIFMGPPRHTRVRSLIAAALAEVLPSGTRGRIEGNVADLVRRIGKEPRLDLVEQYASQVPVLTMLELFGVPPEDRDHLRELIMKLQEGTTFRPGPREPRLVLAEAASVDLTAYVRACLAGRRRAPAEDLFTRLARAPWDEDLATEELLVGTCVQLLQGGHEATTNALAKTTLALLRQPELLALLRARPTLVPAAVDEFLRHDPPAQMVTRWAYQDEQVAGRRIAKGDKVTVVLGAANRDPGRFEEPDTIRFDRDSRAHCGFGMGIHYCLGSVLGRMEVEAGLNGLLGLLPGLRLDAEPVPYRQDLVFHGPSRLEVTRAG